MDPAVGHTPSIRCIQGCGYQTVGVLHQYERDASGPGWHDNLLLEFVAPR
jgi:hypothetical protein